MAQPRAPEQSAALVRYDAKPASNLWTRTSVTLGLALALVSACASYGRAGGKLEALRADRRSSAEQRDRDAIFHYPGDGGVAIRSSYRVNETVDGKAKESEFKSLCVAPPAQAAVAVDISLSGKGNVKVGSKADIGAEFSRSVSEEVNKLFEQNEQTLFVQHALYRLCEAYANGQLNVTERDIVFARLLQASVLRSEYEARTSALESAFASELAQALKTATAAVRTATEAEKTATEAERAAGRAEKATHTDTKKQRRDELKEARKRLADLEAIDTATDKVATSLTFRIEPLRSIAADLRRAKVASTAADGEVTTMTNNLTNATTQPAPGVAYFHAMTEVFATARRLSELDVEREKARAELAKAEADKAKNDVAKAKDEAKAEKERREKLEKDLVGASVERARCKGTDCLRLTPAPDP